MIREILTSKSRVSSMRLMSFIALLWGCALSGYGLVEGKDLMGLTALSSVFVAAAFGGKVLQKNIENKEIDK